MFSNGPMVDVTRVSTSMIRKKDKVSFIGQMDASTTASGSMANKTVLENTQQLQTRPRRAGGKKESVLPGSEQRMEVF